MQDRIDELPQLAKDKHIENKKFFAKLKKRPPKKLDQIMQDLHDQEFGETDCLQCANCCKTTGPLFTDKDVVRISKFLKIKPKRFEEQYLRTDEDNDLVLQQTPCTFLGVDNYCGIYEVRPKACREYPHTDRKKFQQITNITLKNVAICPAAYAIVEKMKARLTL
ncbi:YkgJ family cysteine cluster protein [Aquimarina pacifica]|uniref:YkgJ family cysteine cluster protein n=1 Tax=Aquimarina pacifica TaxID=1296415 RepID=UPI00046E9B2D|nr:YkgJ family cysteine cluster protein [Aquimarina pacifica]